MGGLRLSNKNNIRTHLKDVDQGSGPPARSGISHLILIYSGAQKAQTDSKAEHTRKYVSILNRVDEHLNLYKNRCEIPHSQAGQRRHGHLDVFLRWVLVTITDYPPLTY